MVQIASPTAPAQSSESSISASVGKLSSKLLNRPPTPPRESTKRTASSAQESTLSEVPKTPTSSAESATRNKKQVNWSPWTKYHKPDDPSPLRPAKSSPGLSTPLKSILKPFNPSIISVGLLNSSDQIKAYTYDSFPAMLESITQALASTERSKKLDTYVTFCNTLKAYDNNPDMKAIKNKMPLLSSFIRRDLGAKLPNSANNSGDSQLISQAIKLLTIFVWLPELAESIDDDDAVFFIQHAIQVLKDPSSPKVVVTYFLNFLVSQKFPPKIMTPERANGIIQALKDIETRVSGNTVLTERIGIYGRLLSQAKTVMIARTGDWMEHVLSGVLSNANNKDLRVRALHCMTEAARIIGSEKTVTRSLTNLLNREDGDGVKLFERVTERLSLLIKNGEGVHVTQVWGLVILLLRGKHPISSWEYFTPWLSIIQQCFNSSTVAIKVAANAAWSKLIFVLHCGPEIIPKDMDLLTRPLVRYLDPQYAASNSRGPRQAALSNVCAFLYYNIRPNATPKQLSLAWDVIVVGLIEKLVLAGKHDVEDACRILAALFDGSYQKPWNESRGLEKEAIKADEIMRLDPKWVRLNSAQVLRTLEVAIRKSSWDGDASAIRLLWRKFTKCLADASMKEIKISSETMETVANIFNMLQRLWKEGPPALINTTSKSSDTFMAVITFLIIAAFESIGTLCFTETKLSYDEQNAFVATSTPSNRYSSVSSFAAISHPPIVHLFELFLKPFDGADLSEQYFGSTQSILAKCLEAQDSRRKRLALLSACSAVLPQREISMVDKRAWAILATLTEGALPVKEKTHSSPTPVSWEFKDALKILHWGCRYEIAAWESLFDTFAQVVLSEQGDMQLVSTVIEPMAEILRQEKLDSDSHTWLIHGRTILLKAIYPKSRGPTETTLRVPYGLSSRKAGNIEPYDNLYNMVNQFLVTAYYNCEDSTITNPLKNFIGALIEFMTRCPKGSGFVLLKRIQEGIAAWMTDQKEVMNKKNFELTAKVQGLWASVADTIRKLPRHDSIALQSLAILISSGLESKRKVIVNNSINVWNDTFGTQDTLEYPARVRIVMKKLRPIVDLNLPTFPEDIDEIVPTPPIWDSQESQENLAVDPPLWSSPTPGPSRHRERTSSPIVDSMPSSSKNLFARLKEASKTGGKSKARLKHMDSQLDFAPIAAESQNQGIDSQLLTEHQREVRDRQLADAANLHFVEQSPKPYQGRLSSKGPSAEVKPLNVNPHQPVLEGSSSLEEFVDAPENTTNEPSKNDDDLGEVTSIPETSFSVQVPKRGGSGNPENQDQYQASEELQSKKINNSYDLSVEPEASSKYLTVQNGNEEPISTQEFSTKPAQEVEDEGSTHGTREVFPVTGERGGEIEIIPDSIDMHNTSTPALDIQSTEGQAESESQPENSVIEVPDSYVQDSEEVPDIPMEDSNEAPFEQDSIPKEPSTVTEKGTKKEKIGISAPPKRGRKLGSSKKRKSLQIRTTTKKEEPILDCIMVTPATPKKVHPSTSVPETLLQKGSSPQVTAHGTSWSSPHNTRKRKQQVEAVESIEESEPKPLDPPRKRRATRVPKSTVVELPVETSVETQPENIEELSNSNHTPIKGKRRLKEPVSDYPDVRTPRSSRRRALAAEEIIFDSQPEVVATLPSAAQNQAQGLSEPTEDLSEPTEGLFEPTEGSSLATDSNASAPQAEEPHPEEPHPEVESERYQERGEPKDPITRLKEAIAALTEADLTSAELREAEDEVFEVYVKLREKRRKK